MDDANVVKQSLHVQGLPIFETDIPYIQNICYTINQAQLSIHALPHLNMETPITVLDKGLIL
ncbi:hypothetical protein [Gracilibacillus alcaliphilus]|uniref:hypothetical protein n=1 Tax=Gracilibacillus alcaliphilus TaxID=1401441 RepID=UPI00195652AB|nr:hypothetical protein [Gracilibacillus alcaliphilus]MBM7675121.1 hypothetical protein [Gracilibacillus alcaliphilus]